MVAAEELLMQLSALRSHLLVALDLFALSLFVFAQQLAGRGSGAIACCVSARSASHTLADCTAESVLFEYAHQEQCTAAIAAAVMSSMLSTMRAAAA